MSRLGILLFGHFEIARVSTTDDAAFFCFLLLCTVILNWRSSMTNFVSWGLCLILFKTFSDRSWIRTHAHTRVPEFSTEEFLESGALDRSAILPGLPRLFLYDMCFFNWVASVFLMSRLGILLFGHFEIARVSTTDDVAIFFALGCHLELTFQYERICQLNALPHRVRNVFWQVRDSNPRTYSCTRILNWAIFWDWRFRPLNHTAWFLSMFSFLIYAL